MPGARSGGPSRNVQHGNSINRSGGTVAQFQQKAVVNAYRPTSNKKHATPMPSGTTKTIAEEKIFVAEPNKLPGTSP